MKRGFILIGSPGFTIRQNAAVCLCLSNKLDIAGADSADANLADIKLDGIIWGGHGIADDRFAAEKKYRSHRHPE